MSGYPAYSQSALESVLLILSHFVLIPSFIYLWLGKAFPEATFVAVLFLSSNLYHFCQAGFFCAVDSFDVMQKADHFFVYSVVFWLMMWFIGLSLQDRVCIFFVVQYFLFPLLLFYVHANWLGVAFVVFLVVTFFVLTGVMPNKFPEVHFASLIVLGLLLVAGVIFFVLGGEPGEENYPWTHTLWHVCVMVGIFFLVDARLGNSILARKMYYIIGTSKTLADDLDLDQYVLVDPENSSDEEDDNDDDDTDSDSEDEKERGKVNSKDARPVKRPSSKSKDSKKVGAKLKREEEAKERNSNVPVLVTNFSIGEAPKTMFVDAKSKRK